MATPDHTTSHGGECNGHMMTMDHGSDLWPLTRTNLRCQFLHRLVDTDQGIESMFNSPSWPPGRAADHSKVDRGQTKETKHHKYFSTLQRSHKNDRDKTTATKRSRRHNKTTATKRPWQRDRLVWVCQGTVSCCSNYSHSLLCIDVMNITTSFLPTQMYFRAEWLSEINKFAVISVSLEIFGKRPRREQASNLMGDFVAHS